MTYHATNNGKSTLAVGLGGTVGDTTLQIQVGDVSKFPVINNGGTGSDFTMLTLRDAAHNMEIVKVTRHDSGSSSFTVDRAQEGTSARSWQIGDSVSCRLTAGIVQLTYTHPGQSVGAHAASAISFTPTGNIASTDVQAAIAELDTEKAASGHTHSATAITFTPIGNILSTNVSAALAELDSDLTAAINLLAAYMPLAGGTMTGVINMTGAAINYAKTTVASATTPDIWTGTGNFIDYTGANNAAGFAAAPQPGASRTLICAGAPTFTAGANMLIEGVASGGVLTMAANQLLDVVAITTTQFKLIPRSSQLKIKVVTFTRDISLASGTQAVTGVGFTPKGAIFNGCVDGSAGRAFWGVDDGTTKRVTIDANQVSAGTYQQDPTSIYCVASSGNYAKANVQSWDSDGFTLNWTKTGTPTGTLTINAILFG